VLNIIGIGTAVGQTALGEADFKQLEISGSDSLGANAFVRSGLGRDYLAKTKNSEVNSVINENNQSPTDLGLAAALAAIADAGITTEQIGLVIGDCGTPWQTCPAEGQRVADRLGVKVPAYDLAGGGIISQQIASLSRWRKDRVAEYALLVTTAVPTSRINFVTGGPERFHFGDAASACVVSTKHNGKLAVLDAESMFHGGGGKSFVVDQFLPLVADLEVFTDVSERLTSDAVAKAIFKNKLHGAHIVLACGESSAGMAARIASTHSIARFGESFTNNGYTLSSGCFLAFEQLRSIFRTGVSGSGLKAGDKIVFAQTAPGFVSGYALCEVR